MSDTANDDDQDVLDQVLDRMRNPGKDLLPGGPDVDYVLLVAYVDGLMCGPQRQSVERAIRIWRAWYEAWLDVLLTADEEGNESAPVAGMKSSGLVDETAAENSVPNGMARPSTGGQGVPHWLVPSAAVGLLAVAATVCLMLLRDWPAGIRPQTPQVVLVDGPLRVTSEGQVEGVDEAPAELRQLVERAWQSGKLQLPTETAKLIGQMEQQRGSDPPAGMLSIVSPVGTRVEKDRPTFRWTQVAGASGYRVAVFDDMQNPVIASQPVDTIEWTPPEPLSRGVRYQWQITAEFDGRRLRAPAPPQPPARFEVLSAEETAKLDARRQQLPDSRLLRTALYLELGLLQAAEEELLALTESNTAPPRVRRLLEELRRRRQPSSADEPKPTVPSSAENSEASFRYVAGDHVTLILQDDEAELRRLTVEYYRSYAAEDAESHWALWSDQSTDLKTQRQLLPLLWSHLDFEFGAPQFSQLMVVGESASFRVLVDVKHTTRDGKQRKTQQVDLFRCARDGQDWRMVAVEIAERGLANRLLALQQPRDCDALLAAETELLNQRLCNALLELGNSHYYAQRFEDAVRAYIVLERIAHRIGYSECRVEAWQGLGNVAEEQGKATEALQWYEIALQLARQLRDAGLIAGLLNNMAIVHDLQARYGQALQVYEDALAEARRAGDPLLEASTLAHLGSVHAKLGQFKAMAQRFDQSLALLDAQPESAESQRALGRIRHQMAVVHRRRSDLRTALLMYEQASQLAIRTGDVGLELGALNGRGTIYFALGNYAMAHQTFEQVYDGYEQSNHVRGMATASLNLAAVLGLLERRDEAQEHLQRSLELARQLNNQRLIATRLYSLGNMQAKAKNLVAARLTLKESLDMAKWNGDDLGIAMAYMRLSKMELEGQSPAEALRLAELAVDHAQRAGTLDALQSAQHQAAVACYPLGRRADARTWLEQSIATLDQMRDLAAGDELDIQRFLEPRLDPIFALTSLLAEQGELPEALACAERGKARVLYDIMGPGRISAQEAMTAEEQQAERELLRELAQVNRRLLQTRGQSLRSSTQDKQRTAELEQQLAGCRMRLQAFRTQLYVAHPDLRIQRGDVLPFEQQDLASLIPDASTALLEFVAARPHCELFVVTKRDSSDTKQALIRHYRIAVDHDTLRQCVDRLLEQVQGRDPEYQSTAREMYELLLAPAAEQLAGVERLVIVPEGVLWKVPFHALRDANGEYLLQTHKISYAPSLTVLREMQRRTAPADDTPSKLRLLACGDPSLPQRWNKLESEGPRSTPLQPLPQARRELEQVVGMYGDQQSTMYVGDAAREQRFQSEASGYSVLHLATHGVIDDANPMYSYLLLTPGNLDPRTAHTDDGLLEAWELMRLKLSAELVVLSACETGRGRIGIGEGVIGLSWSLFAAGCPTVVASQWKVDSASTADLMIHFHRELRARKMQHKSSALRNAQLAVLAESRFRHPYYWAGFMLIGRDE